MMLVLPIKKKWFDMIVSGEKKEEYREIKPYYDSRFIKIFGFDYLNKRVELIFRNGYSYDSPSVRCLCILNKGYGKKKWGAEEGKEYYILTIIEIIEIRNWDNPNLKAKQAMAVATLPATKPITATEEIQSEIVKAINKQFSIGIDIGEGISKTGQAIKNVMRGGIY